MKGVKCNRCQTIVKTGNYLKALFTFDYGPDFSLNFCSKNCLTMKITSKPFSEVTIKEVENLYVKKGGIMTEYIIERDNGTNLRFTGQLVASAYDSSHPVTSIKFNLYSTMDGKWVCSKIYTEKKVSYPHVIRRAIIANTEKGVIDFFGTSDFAKGLYEEAGFLVLGF